MTEGIEIRGGAGEFEAAVIAIVLDNLAREESAARARAQTIYSGLPAWVRALPQQVPEQGPVSVTPNRR